MAGPPSLAGRLGRIPLSWNALFSTRLNAVSSGQSGNRGGTKAGIAGGISSRASAGVLVATRERGWSRSVLNTQGKNAGHPALPLPERWV